MDPPFQPQGSPLKGRRQTDGPEFIFRGNRASLEEVIRTPELSTRGTHPPDYQAENRHLAALMDAFGNPTEALVEIANSAMRLCLAHSAAITFLEEENGTQIFKCHALAGQWARFGAGGLPRESTPWRPVLEQHGAVLLKDPERHFRFPQRNMLPTTELLLVPFPLDREAVGALWIAAHGHDRQFNAEDARVAVNLARYAAVARQVLESETHKTRALESHKINDELRRTRRSERRYRRLFEATKNGVLIIDPSTRTILDVNPFAMELLRRSREELIDSDLIALNLLKPEMSDAAFEELQEKGCIQFEDVTLDTGEGMILETTAILYHEGGDKLVQCNIRDITARRKAEEALQRICDQLRFMAESLPQLVWTCLPDGKCDYCNSRMVEYTGLPMEKLLGDGWRECIHPVDRARSTAYWMEAAQGKVPYDFEYRFRRADGVYRWFKVRAVPLRDGEGKIVKWFGTSTDIDENKLAHLLVQESERWLRLIMESVKDYALVTLDLEGRVTGWNSGAEEIAGYKKEEIIGQSIERLFTPEDKAAGALAEERRLALATGFSPCERWIVHKDGHRLFASGAIRSIRDENGEPQGFIKIARDITDRKNYEVALKQAHDQLESKVMERTARLQETIGELEAFSYSVSHDMRSPLRAMHGYSKILLEEYKGRLDPEAVHFLERIHRGASRLDQLIQDVLAYSRVAKGEIELRQVDLEKLIEETLPNHPEFLEPNAHIIIERPLLPVLGHEAYLTQCVTNLLGNAVKFVDPGVVPEIHIRTTREPGGVRVCFEDNGFGIEPSQLARIFQIFGQVYGEKKYGGTGIGLAIVRKAVQRMGGEIGVESEPGKGSRFWFTLKEPANDD